MIKILKPIYYLLPNVMDFEAIQYSLNCDDLKYKIDFTH